MSHEMITKNQYHPKTPTRSSGGNVTLRASVKRVRDKMITDLKDDNFSQGWMNACKFYSEWLTAALGAAPADDDNFDKAIGEFRGPMIPVRPESPPAPLTIEQRAEWWMTQGNLASATSLAMVLSGARDVEVRAWLAKGGEKDG